MVIDADVLAIIGLIACAVLAALLIANIAAGAAQPTEATAEFRKWDKPRPGDRFPAEQVQFMQITRLCPFCHFPLWGEPGTSATPKEKEFLCTNADCNSRFLINPLHPDDTLSTPLGIYLGPCSTEWIAEQRLKQTAVHVKDFAREGLND